MVGGLALATAVMIAAMPVTAPASSDPHADRVLIALGSASDQPYSVEDVERAAQAASAFIRASSWGIERVVFDVTPWLDAFLTYPGCGGLSDGSLDALVAPLRAAVAGAGFPASAYTRVMYTIADGHCGFFGITWGKQVLLVDEPTPSLLVHELGHTFGLGHAAASTCPRLCMIDETGDPFSPMGEGSGDFSTYEKSILGWIGPQPHARSAGTYRLTSADVATTRPQSLVVDTVEGQWWFEYRTKSFRGVLARFVDQDAAVPPFAPSARLILNPTRRGRPWIGAGELFHADPAFTLRVVRMQSGGAVLRFAWRPGSRHG